MYTMRIIALENKVHDLENPKPALPGEIKTLVATISNLIVECVDRAILIHENENRHEMVANFDLPDSSGIAKLKEDLVKELSKILNGA